MERQKRNGGDDGSSGGVDEVKEIGKANNLTRTPNKGSHPRMGNNNTPSTGGSTKRKAGQAGLGSSPLKKTKAGSGRMQIRMPSDSDEDGLMLVGEV